LEDISREELKAKMERGEDFVLLEALPEKSYRRSHLPGAINLPPGQTDQAEELIPCKETEVVV
jgi:rhodanese-related sulfurtransferase